MSSLSSQAGLYGFLDCSNVLDDSELSPRLEPKLHCLELRITPVKAMELVPYLYFKNKFQKGGFCADTQVPVSAERLTMSLSRLFYAKIHIQSLHACYEVSS